MFIRRILLVSGVAAVLTACGGGGSEETGPGFVTADFAGKSLYYVSTSSYQLASFNANGTVLASNQLTTGTPVLNPTAASWSIVNRELWMTYQGLTQKYSLISNNTVNRYYKIKKTSDNGTISTIGWFYDQNTGLSQAQTFVATRQVP